MKDKFILGAHNSWSYLHVRKWWMKPIAFMARCQSVDIKTQYEKYGVRCFDLRIREGRLGEHIVAHGPVEYCLMRGVADDLQYLDEKGDCMVRILHEVRSEEKYTPQAVDNFRVRCSFLVAACPNIRWWCGRNLYNWKVDYDFGDDPKCDEKYGSVSDLKWLYGWWPWLYARIHNRKIFEEGSENILLIDFVNIK